MSGFQFGFNPSCDPCHKKKKCKSSCQKDHCYQKDYTCNKDPCCQIVECKQGPQGPAGRDAFGVWLDVIYVSAVVNNTPVVVGTTAIGPRGLITSTNVQSIPAGGQNTTTYPYFDSVRQGIVLQESGVYEFIWRLQGALAEVAVTAAPAITIDPAAGASVVFTALVNGQEWVFSRQRVTSDLPAADVLFTFNTTVAFMVPAPFFSPCVVGTGPTLVQFAVANTSFANILGLIDASVNPLPTIPITTAPLTGALTSDNAMSITVKKVANCNVCPATTNTTTTSTTTLI